MDARSAHALELELARRDAVLEASHVALERFLEAGGSWARELPAFLADLGVAAGVSRVFISHNYVDEDGVLRSRQLEEWDAEGVSHEGDDPALASLPYVEAGYARWIEVLGGGGVIAGPVRDLPAPEQPLFLGQSVRSFVAVPVNGPEGWWGVLGFDDCWEERIWSSAEIAALRTGAAAVGAALRLAAAEQRVRELDRRYRQVFDHATDGLVISDVHGRVVEANLAYRALSSVTDTLPADVAPTPTSPGTGQAGQRREPFEVSTTDLDLGGVPHRLSVVRDLRERQAAHELVERRVGALTQVAATMVVDQPLDRMLRGVARIVVAASSGEACALHLVDDDDPSVESLVVTHDLPEGYEEALRACWALGPTSPAARAMHDRAVRFIPDARSRSRENPTTAPLHPFLDRVGWEGMLAVPLDSSGRSLGVLHVHYDPGTVPSPEEIGFLSAVGDQVAVAVENARLLAEARNHAVLLERQRLARELHDSVSQALFSMNLYAGTAELAIAGGAGGADGGVEADGALADSLAQVRQLTRTALAEMRALILELRPGALAEEGLGSALRKQVQAFAARTGLEVDLDLPDTRPPLDLQTEEHVYRIVLEALNNVAKHADASRVRVRGIEEGDVLTFEVADDGRGFDPHRVDPGSLGLGTMRSRAREAEADLRVETVAGGGTTVRLSLLVPAPAPG